MSGSNRNTTNNQNPTVGNVKRLNDLAFKAFLRARQEINFETTPDHIAVIERFQSKPDLENIAKALKLAADGSVDEIPHPEDKNKKTNAVELLLEMLEKNSRLLLLRGSVKTAGGVEVNDVTIYEFCLGAGDPELAKLVEPYFAKISDEKDPIFVKLIESYFEKITGKKDNTIDGESERQRQYARYKPYIDALVKQVESETPTYDLKPLFKIIIESSAADITEALNINNTNRTVTRNTPLRTALAKFRNATKAKKSVKDGMHYEHYTTLQQAFDLFDSKWRKLSNNYRDYDKCRLVWRQIIGWLQRSLPRIDRFEFAGAFKYNGRTTTYIWDKSACFPDGVLEGNSSFDSLGFDQAIYGLATNRPPSPQPQEAPADTRPWRVMDHISSKKYELAELMQPPTARRSSECTII